MYVPTNTWFGIRGRTVNSISIIRFLFMIYLCLSVFAVLVLQNLNLFLLCNNNIYSKLFECCFVVLLTYYILSLRFLCLLAYITPP